MSRDTVKAWIQASRPPFFIATLFPLMIGWLLAKGNNWHTGRFLLVILGSFMVHLATNLANDYFEYHAGADSGDAIGGSRVIQQGKISPVEVLRAIIILYVLSFLVAFYLIFRLHLPGLFPLIIFSFLSSLFYVAPPIRYGYHGLGELLVGINMGPLMVVGTYWVIAGEPGAKPFYVSLPVGLMVASILYYQSLPDMKTDLAAGKHTLAVKLGRSGAFLGLVAFFVLIYASMIALVLTQHLSWPALLCMLSLPVFFKMIHIVKVTEDWVRLDQYGKYVRILYFLISCTIIAGLF
jgi:1,4-dihydroxy-2-naphthoate polyprenyltransferase